MRNQSDHRLEEPDFISSLGRTPRSELKLLPARAGVYYAIDDGARVWYVGQSKNLRERLPNHEKLALFDARKVTYIAYILLEEPELDEWEQKSLQKFSAPLNLKNVCDTNTVKPYVNLSLTPEEQLERYAMVKRQIKELEYEIKVYQPNIISFLEDSGESLRLAYASFSIGTKTTWQYTPELEAMKKEISLKEKYEQASGIATVKSVSLFPICRLIG